MSRVKEISRNNILKYGNLGGRHFCTPAHILRHRHPRELNEALDKGYFLALPYVHNIDSSFIWRQL